MKSPLIPMAAITGKPDKTLIFDFVKSFKENSIDQIMIYPRSGCELEYLSDEWFDTVANYIDVAKQLDVAIWLYDEFNWPSGDAGGLVTKNPEFRLKSFKYIGENKGEISTHSTHNADIFGEKYFPDLLNENAAQYFIECTHEKYYTRFKDDFGKTIKGFFTDEPSIGYACSKESLPYYYGLETDYFAKFNRNFENDLNDEYENFKSNVFNLIGERFNRCYLGKITDWCTNHGILSTGHFAYDDTPYSATHACGNFLKNLKSLSIPGIDELRSDYSSSVIFSLLSGAEYTAGENGTMAELFALGPCNISYTAKRSMIYLASCFKINHYFLAISHLDVRGNAKIKDYYNDFTTTQPDFCGIKLLTKEAIKAAELSKKTFTPDVYVMYPTDVCANNYGRTHNIHRHRNLLGAFVKHQISWKFATEEDDTCNVPVVDFNGDMSYKFEGSTFVDPVDICQKLDIKPQILTETGELPEKVFVRKYDDGTFVVLNLKDEEIALTHNGKPFKLEEKGVLVFKNEVKCEPEQSLSPIPCNFDVFYKHNNFARAMYINDQTSFEIYSKFNLGVVFAVRNDANAQLDGIELEYTNDSKNVLPRGFNGLYKISKPYTLSEGKHVLTSANDLKYMPSVLITGDFNAESVSGELCSVELLKRDTKYRLGEKITDFGEVAFACNLTVPKNAIGIKLNGTMLYTEIYFDNRLLGAKIYAPYIYRFNDKFKDKSVMVKIIQKSSISTMFGDTDYINQNHNGVGWKDTPSSSPSQFGFDKIEWVTEI